MGEISKEPVSIKSELWPWLNKTEEVKFLKGIPGETSDRWIEKPNLPPCWKGAERVWNMDAESSQIQCWCPVHKRSINASGSACHHCELGVWPKVAFWQSKVLSVLETKLEQAEAITEGVRSGMLSEQDALELVEKNGLSDHII